MVFNVLALVIVLLDAIWTIKILTKSKERKDRLLNVLLLIFQLITISVIIASIVIERRGI